MRFPVDPRSSVLILVLATASCGVATGHAPVASPDSRVDTRWSGTWSRAADGVPGSARTAGDLLRCCVHSWHLQMARGGPAAGLAASSPLLVLDGKPVLDLDWLEHMPASHVERIRLLSPVQGVRFFGPRAGRGAILVETRRGRPLAR